MPRAETAAASAQAAVKFPAARPARVCTLRLPRPLTSGTLSEQAERAKARRAAMETAFPGVRFSLYTQNPAGVRAARAAGLPSAGQPEALYDAAARAVPAGSTALVPALVAAARRWGPGTDGAWTGYVTFNTLVAACGASYADVFAAINALRARDPRAVRLSVNRLGDPTHIALRRDAGALLAAPETPARPGAGPAAR